MEYQIEENNIYTRDLCWVYFRKGYAGVKNADGFVTARDGEVITGSMGYLEIEAGLYQFLHLVVHPDYRRQGIGTRIIQEAVGLFKKEGAWLIRNHKSSNLMPYDIFNEMGFKLATVHKHNKKKVRVYELNLAYPEQTYED